MPTVIKCLYKTVVGDVHGAMMMMMTIIIDRDGSSQDIFLCYQIIT